MEPKPTNHDQHRLFERTLTEQLNPDHELMIFAELLDWESLENEFKDAFAKETGAPAKPVRLVLGIMLLQHMYGLSDEGVVRGWLENPYWQYFCGYDYLQWSFPLHPTTLVKWRKRIGPEGIEKVASKLLDSALNARVITEQDLKKVIVDTTVMPKAIAYPTDARLYFKGIKKLVRFAKAHNIALRQSYRFLSKKAFYRANMYAHCRKMKRAQREIKRLKTYLGRIYRQILEGIWENIELTKRAAPVLSTIGRVLLQDKEDKNKVYSINEPHVECISKGKAHKKYEFGVKASYVISHSKGIVISGKAFFGNPYDGHTLKNALEVAEKISGQKIEEAYVDKGYRGHKVDGREVVVSGTRIKRQITGKRWKAMLRRQAIEPHIGHMKSDGRLGRNELKGKIGDEINAILCGMGHNCRLIINFLRSRLQLEAG